MSSRGSQPRRFLDEASDVIFLGFVMFILGTWVLAGDVTLGSITLEQSNFFGGVALAAGLLLLVGGSMKAVRSRRKKLQRRQ
ncbi:hypothetical protein [Brachybacterium phenoliresistens]|uniref:hypothetical protein n=1 Tax=Brachybacterium phenoliresistens TaxID=396014 RepID=UPI0031DFE282